MLRSISEFPNFYEEREKKLFGKGTLIVRTNKKSRSPEKLPSIKQPGITVQKCKRFNLIYKRNQNKMERLKPRDSRSH